MYIHHSTYSSYARGLSILVYGVGGFSCELAEIDKYRSYVFLHCRLLDGCFVIANVYIQPPYSCEVFQIFAKFIADIMPLPVLLMGDRNNVFKSIQDRFPPSKYVNADRVTPWVSCAGHWVCTIFGVNCILWRHSKHVSQTPTILFLILT